MLTNFSGTHRFYVKRKSPFFHYYRGEIHFHTGVIWEIRDSNGNLKYRQKAPPLHSLSVKPKSSYVWNWTADVEPGLYTIRIRQPIEEARELDKKINVLPSKTMQCLSSKKEQQDGSHKEDVKEYLLNQGFELAKDEEGAKPEYYYILVDEDDGRCITIPKDCSLNEITRKLILEQAESERPKNLAKKLCKEEYKYTYQSAHEGEYTGQCHEFPGAISQANTEKQLRTKMKEAIGLVRKRVEKQAPKSEHDIVNTPHSKSKRLKALLRRRRRRKRGSEPLKKNELVS